MALGDLALEAALRLLLLLRARRGGGGRGGAGSARRGARRPPAILEAQRHLGRLQVDLRLLLPPLVARALVLRSPAVDVAVVIGAPALYGYNRYAVDATIIMPETLATPSRVSAMLIR